jgi:hypothetical protein
MDTRNLKALNESIESVMSHDEARDIVHDFIHSLTELASQTDGLEEGYQAKRMRLIRKYVKLGSKVPDRLKDFMQRSYKKKRQRGRVIEPGGSVKEIETRAGKRTAAMRAKGLREEASQTDGLEEGYQAKRMRVIKKEIRKSGPATGKVAEYLKKTFARKKVRRGQIAAKYPEMSKKYGGGALGDMHTRAALRKKAMDAKGLSEEASLSEGMYKKLMRLKGKAYKSQGSPSYGKVKRGEAELEAKVSAQRARRGGAPYEAVKGGGSPIGKRGKPTDKAARLADQRQRGLSRFHGREIGHEYGIIRGGGKAEDKGQKRRDQQAQAEFEKKSRTGDFPTNSKMLKQVLSWKYRKNK